MEEELKTNRYGSNLSIRELGRLVLQDCEENGLDESELESTSVMFFRSSKVEQFQDGIPENDPSENDLNQNSETIPNREKQFEEDIETEEDGYRAGAIRILKIRHMFKAMTGRDHALLTTRKDNEEKKE